jgi:hypothetical protein
MHLLARVMNAATVAKKHFRHDDLAAVKWGANSIVSDLYVKITPSSLSQG